jgi:hypothetical protein
MFDGLNVQKTSASVLASALVLLRGGEAGEACKAGIRLLLVLLVFRGPLVFSLLGLLELLWLVSRLLLHSLSPES